MPRTTAAMDERWLVHVPEAERTRLAEAGALAVELGVGLFLVGGCVRDAFLGRGFSDWDLVVEGDGPRFAERLAAARGGTVVHHATFLTSEVRLPGLESVHVSTARREVYPRPGALPVVSPASIEEDLWRRDFSVNALAVCLLPDRFGELLDPTGGVGDLERRWIRALHARSFVDDPTRIVRAVGFEQRLGFTLEPETEQWLAAAVRGGALGTVSTERLAEALLPLLGNCAGPDVLARLRELGVLEAMEVLGPRPGRRSGAMADVKLALAALGEAEEPHHRAVACLVALLVEQDARADEVEKRLHLTRPLAREVREAERALRAWETGFQPASKRGDLWAQLRDWGFGGIVALWLATTEPAVRSALAEYWRELRQTRPDVTAEQLLALGVPSGPAIGSALTEARRLKLNQGAGPEDQLAAALAVGLAAADTKQTEAEECH